MRVFGAIALVMTLGVVIAHAQATTPGQVVQPQQPQPSTTQQQRMPATMSPKGSRSTSQFVSLSWYGANCAYADNTCAPAGARRGSSIEGMVNSIHG